MDWNRRVVLIVALFTICCLGSSLSQQSPLVSEPWCQYRDYPQRYPPEVFRLHGCGECYFWYNRIWFTAQLPGVYRYSPTGLRYTGIVVNGTAMDADYDEPVAMAAVAASFKEQRFTNKWVECCKAAERCCDFMMTLSNQDEVDGCGATWDGWQCWENEKNNNMQYSTCPAFTYAAPPTCHHPASKECYVGEWNVTSDFTTCDVRPRLRSRLIFHVSMMVVSMVVAVPAIVIFFSYRKLRQSTRVVLHRNLLIAIVLRNIFTVTNKTAVLLDALRMNPPPGYVSVMARNELPCKIFAVCERLAANAVFATMLLLGIFLHRLIAAAFKGEPNMLWYYVAATVVNCVPVIAWTVVMTMFNDHNCWTVDDGSYHWINDGPRIIMLFMNLILIGDIIRVLVTKLSSVKSRSSSNVRRTIKATIFLAPVFGVQFLFTAFRPNTTDCVAEQVYYFFSYAIDGLQGALVSLLFCYLNNEVQTLLRRSFCASTSGVGNPSKTNSTFIEPNNKDLDDPPTPVMDTRSVAHRPAVLNGILVNRKPSSNSESEYYSPFGSVSGSVSQAFYTPKSSVGGQFFDCVDEPIVEYQSGGVSQGVGGRERSASEYFDVKY